MEKGLSEMQKKLKGLWADSRSYKKRLLLSGSAMLAACFMFLFCGPVELVAASAGSLVFSWRDVAGLLALTGLLVWVAGALLIALLRGKIFNYAVSVAFALTVAGFLQAAFMNGGLGTLTGDGIDWTARKGEMVGNLLIWVSVLLVTLFVMYLNREWWKKTVIFGSLLLIAMHLVPVVSVLFSKPDDSQINGYYLSEAGMYEFSKEDNVFVFVLDRLDYSYIEKALQENPEMLQAFDGFTGYTNAVSAYARTRPALAHLLTGYTETAYQVPAKDYYQDIWTDNATNILEDLKAQDYSVSLYTKMNYLFSDASYAQQHVENVGQGRGKLVIGTVLKRVLNLSAYRYAPLALKPYFWADTNYYNNGIYTDTAYEFNDSVYAEGFAESTAEKSANGFKLYHFYGPHAPYTMNADGTSDGRETNVTAQTLGSFVNLQKIFDQMKELGIYEDATIIITADHGNPISDRKPIQQATLIGLFYKPSGSAGTPFITSDAPVSTQNIPATLAKAIGVDYSAYGTPLDEVAEDAQIVRYTYKSIIGDQGGKEIGLYTYEITGDARDFSNWKIVDQIDIDHSFY